VTVKCECYNFSASLYRFMKFNPEDKRSISSEALMPVSDVILWPQRPQFASSPPQNPEIEQKMWLCLTRTHVSCQERLQYCKLHFPCNFIVCCHDRWESAVGDERTKQMALVCDSPCCLKDSAPEWNKRISASWMQTIENFPWMCTLMSEINCRLK
jgi:hypothetical protein